MMGFEQFGTTPETLPDVPEAAVEAELSELTFEQERDAIFNEAAAGRATLLERIRGSQITKFVSTFANFIPGGEFKIGAEAALAHTATGEKLSGRERVMQGIIAGGTLAANALMLTGFVPVGLVVRGGVALLSTGYYGPDVLRQASAYAREKFPDSDMPRILDATAAFIERAGINGATAATGQTGGVAGGN